MDIPTREIKIRIINRKEYVDQVEYETQHEDEVCVRIFTKDGFQDEIDRYMIKLIKVKNY